MKKGQGSTEYLVILAVVLVVALIVIGLLGQFTEFGSTTLEQQSKSYWLAATPFSFVSWKINSTEVKVEIQNREAQLLNLTDVKFDGTTINATAGGMLFAPGENKILTSLGYTTPCTTTGQLYQINTVTIYYNGAISGLVQSGKKPLYGKCA